VFALEVNEHMRKSLFNASFEASQKISPNLFSAEKSISYRLGLSESLKFFPRVAVFIGVVVFSIMMYVQAVGFSDTTLSTRVSDEVLQYVSEDIIKGMGVFGFIKPIITVIISILLSVSVLNFFPKKNYMVQRIFGVISVLLLGCGTVFVLMPIALGITLGATGWLGFIIICLWGIGLWGTVLQFKIQQIRYELYGDSEGVACTYVGNVWRKSALLCLFVFLIVPFGFVGLNIFWWQIGLDSTPTNLNYVWMFAGVVYFSYITVFIWVVFKLFISSFYFAKYAEQYRVLWNVTDEDWYGERKARKMQRRAEKMKKSKEEISQSNVKDNANKRAEDE